MEFVEIIDHLKKVNMDIIEQIENDPELKKVIECLEPYLPALNRVKHLYNEFISFAYVGQWILLDELMFPYMNDKERDLLSQRVLQEARKDVDRILFIRKISKEIFIELIQFAIERLA